MILTSKIHRFACLVAIILSGYFAPVSLQAQETLVLSVSPTLFEMTANENQNWSSSIRVINANPYPITVYAEPVNFESEGEAGLGSLIPVLTTSTEGQTLAEWIQVTDAEIVIPPEQTINVPFTISVPEGASPGGHFAAILIGTKPNDTEEGLAQVETSQVVTSLVFLRVAGDIVEDGNIREFTTTKSVYENTDIDFSIRFENKGNVHLQPQGEIEIWNMWGNERGKVPVNQFSQFGNVLPESVREYNFTWSSEWSWADIGRNKAVISLAYGEDSRKFTNSTTYFWVIPWKLLLVVITILAGTIAIIVWGIKLYVRKMLQLAGVTPELQRQYSATNNPRPAVSVTAPLEAGILDLRAELALGEGGLINGLMRFIERYRAFALVCLAVLILIGLLMWYVILIIQNDFSYSVQYEQPDGSVVEIPVTAVDDSIARIGDGIAVQVINQSNDPKVSDIVKNKLTDSSYEVKVVDEFGTVPKDRSVIVYDPVFLDTVRELEVLFPNILLSAYVSENDEQPSIILYAGTDLLP